MESPVTPTLFPTLVPFEPREGYLRETIYRRVRFSAAQSPLGIINAKAAFRPFAEAVRDLLVERMLSTEERYRKASAKRAYYLSMEFLIGRSLGDSLTNLRISDECSRILAELGLDLSEMLEIEPDAGLGNGGLGRLAACFLESMATLGMPAVGYGIDYQYGLFRQEIVNGYQHEQPDRWRDSAAPLFIDHGDEPYLIPLYGRVEHTRDSHGNPKCVWVDYNGVIGVPHDLPVAGFGGHTVNRLRLFSARSPEEFSFEHFNNGDYIRAVEKKIAHENISRVLYPADTLSAGKELRLLQEYFLVACSIRDVVRRFILEGQSWSDFPSKVTLQMNDTHPSLAVAELMRMLVDGCDLEWSQAWQITQATLAYTNHTLMPEALEKWPVSLLHRVLPRHTEIILEINRLHLERVCRVWPGDVERIRRLSLIEEGSEKQVRMAHLAIVGSHSVNGVSELHSHLLKTSLFSDFHELWPERFSNKTNGASPRLWILKSNPSLAALLNRTVGDGWVTDLSQAHDLENCPDLPGILAEIMAIKRQNKERLSSLIANVTGITVDPASLFDVQIKRIHEYKRQLLNVMRIVHEYLRLVEDGEDVRASRTYIFAGKAAPGYWAAKQIIKLIHNVGNVVNTDPRVAGRLRVVFLPDYRVSLAEAIIPAADLSEQISTAGMEASGTGNMKLAMNGALTIGTWDGANIEMRNEVHPDNIYMFGHSAQDLAELRQTYNPRGIYENNPRVRRVIGAIGGNRFSSDQPGLFAWIYYALLDQGDRYFHVADFESYLEMSEVAEQEFTDRELWATKAFYNITRMGRFSSDRTVAEYARDIWQIERVNDPRSSPV